MMKKTMIMMFALLLLTACGTNGGGDGIGTTPFIGGTQGIKMEFVENFPPERVSDGSGQEDFDIVVKLTNKGEAEVAAEDVRVRLSGFSPHLFGYSADNLTKTAPENIESNIKNPDGSIIASLPVEVDFERFRYQQAVQGTQSFPLRAEICYLYSTFVASTICVKEDFRSDQTGDICTVASTRTAFNSAAPLQVIDVRQTAARQDTTRIVFTIANRDSGKVFRHDSLCESEGRMEDRVYVQFQGLNPQEGEEVNCRSLRTDDGSGGTEGYVTLNAEGRAEVSCDVTFDERTPRIQPFGLELSYKYNENIQRNIIVERSD
ncbi:MAG: hypothetical protein ACMXX7_00925 [Candidatus Woesearchaeota archaeon]